MKLIRRVLALSLVAVLLLSFPLTSFAASAAVPTVAEYIFDTLLSANGIDTSFPAVKSWLGTWTGYDDYLDQGSKGKLGAYSQWLYDRQHSAESEEIRERARQQVEAMTSWMDMDWSDVGGQEVELGEGILDGYATSIKAYLRTFSSYGSSALEYIKALPAVSEDIENWNKPSSFGKCIYHYTTKSGGYLYHIWYFLPSWFRDSDIAFAYLDFYRASMGKWDVMFKYLSNTAPTIGKVSKLSLYAHRILYDLDTGAYVTSDDFDISVNSGASLTVQDARGLTIPVFSSEAAADAYASSKVLEGLANQESFGLPVNAVNKDAQTTEFETVPNVITLPATGDIAAQLLGELSDAMDRIDRLEAALKDAGLLVGWGDIVIPTVAPTDVEVPGEDTETKTTLAAILAKVEAIPATIEAMLNNKLGPGDTDEDVENMKLPTSLADKFPFCIPFDVIYLVKAMNASSEVPRFELPFKIHYQNINYENTFIVDMTEWDAAVKILRTMLDLLFIAGLISTTRELIRG